MKLSQSSIKRAFKAFKKHFKAFGSRVKKDELQSAYDELSSAYSSLSTYKELLEKRVKDEIEKREMNEQILSRQSRLAAMGEMIDAVAHQWAQPLSVIDMRINMINFDYENGAIDKAYIDELVSSVNHQVEYMSTTLKKFRNFFKSTEMNENFELNTMVKNGLLLIKDELIKNHIIIDFEEKKDIYIDGSISEITHVLINLINNSKDAFIKNNKQHRVITIKIKDKSLYCSLSVEDNGGGIDEAVLSDIFKPYVSTKKGDESSGIGLYMSTLIMQKHNGNISAKNRSCGAKFTLKFYKEQ
jgi:C4-dicarboxylate-specific signal transduction histidine kinase